MKKIISIDMIGEFIELIADSAFIKDTSGTYTHCNGTFENFIHKTKNEIVGKTDYDLFPKKNADKCFEDDQNVLNSEDMMDFEDSVILEDGETIYFRTTKQKIVDQKNGFEGIFTIIRDITKMKQYELLYEDNNELLEYMNYETDTNKILKKIIDLSEKRNTKIKCFILLLDKSKNYLNKGIDPHLSLTQKADLHLCWAESIFSMNNEILGTFEMYNNKPSKPNDFQLKLMHSYAHLASVAIEKGYKEQALNTRKRKILEKELVRKTKDLRLFKQVVENINYGITITKADGRNEILYVNKAFENLTGYTKKEVIGKNCKFLQQEDTKQESISTIKNGIKNNKKTQIELRNYKKDGTMFYNALSISPVYDTDNILTHFVGIQKDVTLNKKQELNVIEQAKLASMGEMIANIAHQWRQPLSVISTASTGMQLQKEYGLLKDIEFNKACDAINDNVQYLSQTIDDFKSFIKNDSVQKYFKIDENIHKFLSLVSGTIKSSNIQLILDLDSSIQINGYENELIQCYMNIFNNAKDALEDRPEKLLFISTYLKKNKVVISIKDNAGGISQDIISKIFEPYFTTKHKFQGTGLGLHMTYNLIESGMSGTIEVLNTTYIHNQKEFQGANFLITLPLN
ncbi:MAG: PAS domain S-box protein [Arcobacteraceae bacterium]